MANLVPSHLIEDIVGVKRHPDHHIGRAVSSEEMMYILHSRQCFSEDMLNCEFTWALDRGIEMSKWGHHLDIPVKLEIDGGHLVPGGIKE